MQSGMDRKLALFIGRFQPFHKGHREALLHLFSLGYDALVVVGSSDQNYSFANPLTSGERLEMVRTVINHEKWNDRVRFLVPFPDISDNMVWTSALITSLPRFSAVFGNNELVSILFEKNNYLVIRPPLVDRTNLQGLVIRQRIQNNESWKDSVPSYLHSLLYSYAFEERLRHAGLSV